MKSAIDDFTRLRPTYEDFTSRLRSFVEDLLKLEGIEYHQVTGRTKSVDSFSNKIERKAEKYSEPMTEITDLTGVRIVVYDKGVLDTIDRLINENFIVDLDNSVDKGKLLNYNEFGYRSAHYVIILDEKRAGLREWSLFKRLKAEIQVQTALQNAWSSISHTFDYKRKEDVPSLYRRKLYLLAGVLELADEQFLEIRESERKYQNDLTKPGNEPDAAHDELNLLTLTSYFSNKNDLVQELEDAALHVGFRVHDAMSSKYISALVQVGNMLDLRTVSAFDQFIRKRLHLAVPYLEEIYKHGPNVQQGWDTYKDFTALLFLLCFLNESQLDKFNGEGWARSIWVSVSNAILNRISLLDLPRPKA